MKKDKFPFFALFSVIMFGGLQYYQLSKLIDAQATPMTVFWIVFDIIWIAGYVAEIVIYVHTKGE